MSPVGQVTGNEFPCSLLFSINTHNLPCNYIFTLASRPVGFLFSHLAAGSNTLYPQHPQLSKVETFFLKL